MDLKSIFGAIDTKFKTFSRRIENLERIQLPVRSTGTFTPAFRGTTTAGTFTYNIQRGYYSRVGNRVDIVVNVGISAISVAPTGAMEITGLPFTAAATVTSIVYSLYFGAISQLDYPAGALQLLARIDSGTNYIRLLYSVDNAVIVNYPAASFTNPNAALYISGAYFV